MTAFLTGGVSLGALPGGLAPSAGTTRDLAVYARALTAAEVAALTAYFASH